MEPGGPKGYCRIHKAESMVDGFHVPHMWTSGKAYGEVLKLMKW